VHLREALAGLTVAKNTLSKCEAALPAARPRVTEAARLYDAAKATLAEIEGGAAERVAIAIFEGRAPGTTPSAAAARLELATATEGLVVAQNARARGH
jgi:hypothetical protein